MNKKDLFIDSLTYLVSTIEYAKAQNPSDTSIEQVYSLSNMGLRCRVMEFVDNKQNALLDRWSVFLAIPDFWLNNHSQNLDSSVVELLASQSYPEKLSHKIDKYLLRLPSIQKQLNTHEEISMEEYGRATATDPLVSSEEIIELEALTATMEKMMHFQCNPIVGKQ